jgi:hypothetical protein
MAGRCSLKTGVAECRQNAWNAACNADYVAKHFDDLIAKYEKLKKEDTAHEEQIKAPDNAIDYKTKDRR